MTMPLGLCGASHTKLVFEGEAAPGSQTFHAPSIPRGILSNGAAVYQGSTTGGVSAFFSVRPGDHKALVSLTTPVPGPDNRHFTDLDAGLTASYAVNRRGDLVFFARTRLPDNSGNATGLFLRTAAGQLHRLAHDGDAAPGGSVFDDVYFGGQPSISNNGQHVVFVASLFGVPGMAIYHATITGNSVDVQRLVHLSGPAPDGGVWEDFQPFVNVRGLRAVNDSGHIAFSADTSLSSGSSHVYFWNGTTVTEVPGSEWTEQLMMNNAGQMVLQRSTGTGSNIHYTFGTAASTEVILRNGDAAPGSGGGTFNTSVGKPILNEAGQVAFSSGELNAPHDSGIFLWSKSAGLKAVVRTGSTPPGGGIYSTFSTTYDNPQLSETGHVYFLNDLTDGSFNDYPTIFMGDGDTLVRVIGKGDTLEGELVKDVDMALRGFDPAQAENLANHGPVNERGQLVYWAELNTSGKEGLFRYNPEFPEPDIAVEQPVGTGVAPGGTVAFGSVVAGGGSTRTVKIINSGELELNDLEVSVDGANADQFDLGDFATTSLEKNGSAELTVEFSPTSTGAKTAVLHITSNDPDESPYALTLTGTGTAVPAAIVKTTAATGLMSTTVTLNGTVNAKGSARAVFFDYGPTTSYGTSVAATPDSVSDTGEQAVSATVSGLLPHTKYHFRVRITGGSGVINGGNLTFTTPNRSPTVANDQFDLLPGGKLTLALFANDSDPDGDALSVAAYTAVAPASAGKLAKVGNALVFTASSTFSGASFNYSAKDAFGGLSGAAMVMLNLTTCTIDPTTADIPSAGASYPVTVSGTGAWSAIESLPWVSVSPASGVGGTVTITLQPNTGLTDRIGVVTIGGKPHTVTQRGVVRPTLTPPAMIPQAIVGGYYELLIPTTNFPVTYTITQMPPGLTINATTGLISGTPTKGGPYDMTVSARNAKGSAVTTLNFTITVAALKEGVVGVFHGLVDPHEDINANLGSRLELTTTATGGYTGKIITGAASIALKGVLSADPLLPNQARCLLSIPRKGAAAWLLDVTLNHSTQLMQGTVGDGGPQTTPVLGWRKVWSTSVKAEGFGGLYTFSLTQPDSDPSLPQGYGFGSFKCTSLTTGAVTISGKLADGSGFTTATFFSEGGRLLLYQSLYGGRGSLAGSLNVMYPPGSDGLAHGLRWFKPDPLPTSKETLYKAGFGPLPLTVNGGPSPGLGSTGVVMNISNTDNNARLVFAAGGLDTEAKEFTQDFSIRNPNLTGKTNKATIPSNLNKLTMPTLNVTTGAFSGTFVLPSATPALKRTVSYQGLIVQGFNSPARGYGFFILPASTATTAIKKSGSVLLRAAQ